MNTAFHHTHTIGMEFLPGNEPEEWQYLGEGDNAIPYQQVTLYDSMQWSDFPLENFNAACSQFSGNRFGSDFT